MLNVLLGGPLKGYRTYILVGLAVITIIAQWAVGDLSAAEAFTQLVTALSVGTVRAAIQ